MKRNIFKICLAALIVSGTFTSCSNDRDDKFEDLPSVRESKQAKELEELLFSADHGWKLQYFTDDTELGGYTFLMKFHGGNYVEMISDFDEDGYKLQGSEYQIQLRGTTSLVFATENKIHKLSDPFNSPTTASEGYKGDFQFRYYGKTENEIIFRGTKDIKKEIRFIKATPEDWDNFEKRKPVNEYYINPAVPIFRTLEISNNGSTNIYDGVFGAKTRFFEFNEEYSILGKAAKGFALAYTNEGAEISPVIEVDGVEIKEFKWDATNKNLISVNSGDVKAMIKNVTSPSKWKDDYKALIFGNNETPLAYFTNDDIAKAPGNSTYFKEANRDASGNEIVSRLISFYNAGDISGNVAIQYQDATTKSIYQFSGKILDTNGRLTIQNGRWNSTPPQKIKELHDKVFPVSGYFLKKQTYKVKWGNVIWTTHSGSDTTAFDSWMY